MYCSNCGNELTGKFCSSCGVPASGDTPAPEPVDNQKQESAEPTWKDKSLSFKERLKLQVQDMHAQGAQSMNANFQAKAHEKEELIERIKRMDQDGIAYCPKCYSTSLSPHKKGFGVGKAIVGAGLGVMTVGASGLLGLAAGNAGAKKIRVTCLKCGHQFWAGQK